MPPEPIAFGSDDHIGSDWSRAGGRSSGLPLNFADTESAGAEGGELMRDAEAGDRNPGLPRSHIDGIARLGGDRPVVDGQTQHDTPVRREGLGVRGRFKIVIFRLTPYEFIREMLNRRHHRVWGTAP